MTRPSNTWSCHDTRNRPVQPNRKLCSFSAARITYWVCWMYPGICFMIINSRGLSYTTEFDLMTLLTQNYRATTTQPPNVSKPVVCVGQWNLNRKPYSWFCSSLQHTHVNDVAKSVSTILLTTWWSLFYIFLEEPIDSDKIDFDSYQLFSRDHYAHKMSNKHIR